jgi:hypothetical protein
MQSIAFAARTSRVAALGLAVALVLFGVGLSASFAQAATGAIYTTESSCTGVNVNLFDTKDAVYLDGGPHHEGSAGLPDGAYYVQVTEPNGTLLGKTAGPDAIVTDGSFVNCYQLSVILRKASDNTAGYDTTTNGGGVYKVWVSTDPTFAHGTNKTDNFKVKEGAVTPLLNNIGGMKWGDLNADGLSNGSEVGLENWTIELWNSDHTGSALQTTTTDEDGNYVFTGLTDGTYQVCEVMQAGWYQSYPGTDTPTCHTVSVSNGQSATGKDFGNYQYANLTVIKHVVNDNGGTAVAGDFTMNVTSNGNALTGFSGDEAGTVVSIKPGTYSVDEGLNSVYAKTIGANCSGGVTSGGTASCTITNDDIAPSLTLNKVVINNNNGVQTESAWTLTANGGIAGTLSGPGATGATDVVSGATFQAGTYALSESGPAGYHSDLGWQCAGTGTPSGSNITLGIGQSAVCTIINDDNPPTRTQGFWSTHTTLTDSHWVPQPLCTANNITATPTIGANQVMGGFLSDIAKKTDGKQRASLDKTRMVLLQQLFAAILNHDVLGAGSASMITAGKAAYCGNSAAVMTAQTGILDAFNGSGDPTPLPSSINQGNATPSLSQSQADKVFWNTTSR